MTLRVTVEDIDTGDSDTALVQEGDYFLVTHDPCELTHTQVYSGGKTHVLTIKGRIPRGAR